MYRRSKFLRQIYLLDASLALSLFKLFFSAVTVLHQKYCEHFDFNSVWLRMRARSFIARVEETLNPIKCSAVDQNINQNNQKYVNNTKTRVAWPIMEMTYFRLLPEHVDDDENFYTFLTFSYQFPRITGLVR